MAGEPAGRWGAWVRLWDRQEAPHTLALLRLLLAGILLCDQIRVVWLRLIVPLWGPASAGGIGDPLFQDPPPLLYRLAPDAAGTADVAFWVWTAATLLFGLGWRTRWTGLVGLLLYGQLALVLPGADRGIDMLIRNVWLVLILSPSARVWSLDARRITGRWSGDPGPAPAWARHLLILQRVVVYFTAGVQKVALAWTPMGHFSALYIVLHDPAVSRISHLDLLPWYPLTQLATASTVLWEWSAPLLALSIWYRDTRLRPGRLRAWMNRHDLRTLWLGIGVVFHVGIHLTMQIGIFPFMMMALYVVGYHPDEILRLLRWRRR